MRETKSINRLAIELKQEKRIKIPDAIIAATAIDRNLPLITADQEFAKIQRLCSIIFES
jgi:predicted nucleic acid-binding protein